MKARTALGLAGSKKVLAIYAKSNLGLAESLSGQFVAGRKECEEAVQLARSLRNPRWLSEALLASAEASLAAGDAQSARTSAAEAQSHFTGAGQHESEWRAYAIEARATEKLGDKEKARQLGSKAADTLASLEGLWGSDNFKSYLRRPDIAEARRQLEAITGRSN